MSRTDQLLADARTAQIARASRLQTNLGSVLTRLAQPEYTRIREGLQKLKDQHIALLDEGIEAGFISESDYRRLMGEYIDQIGLSDLLSALS